MVRGLNLEAEGQHAAQMIIALVVVNLHKRVGGIFAGESDEPRILLVFVDVVLDVQTPVIAKLKVILQEDVGRMLGNPAIVVGHAHKGIDPLIA